MRLWNGIVAGGFVGALVLCLCTGQADAATKKRVTATKPAGSAYSLKQYLSGTNLEGRSGLFWGDTSEVAGEGQIEGSAHMTYQTAGNQSYSISLFTIPVGAHFGLAPDFELSAGAQLGIVSTPSYTIHIPPFPDIVFEGETTTNVLVMGGAKYRFPGNRQMPDFSFGGVVYIPTFEGGQVLVMPQGTVSYMLDMGLFLNGNIGIGISNSTYVMADVGAGYPISNQITGIAEIGANQAGNGGSVFAFGIRAALSDIKLQCLLGIPMNGGNVLIGGGIILGTH